MFGPIHMSIDALQPFKDFVLVHSVIVLNARRFFWYICKRDALPKMAMTVIAHGLTVVVSIVDIHGLQVVILVILVIISHTAMWIIVRRTTIEEIDVGHCA